MTSEQSTHTIQIYFFSPHYTGKYTKNILKSECNRSAEPSPQVWLENKNSVLLTGNNNTVHIIYKYVILCVCVCVCVCVST